MTFLVLVIALLVVFTGIPGNLQRDAWFARWWAWLSTRLAGRPLTRLAVAVLAPVIGLALVLEFASDGLFGLVGLVVNLLVLLYAFGRGDLEGEVRLYRDDLDREDTQAAWHDAAGLDARHRESAAANWRELHDQAVEAVAYRYFERDFPVLLWFVLLGAPGALLYRLAALALNRRGEAEGAGPAAGPVTGPGRGFRRYGQGVAGNAVLRHQFHRRGARASDSRRPGIRRGSVGPPGSPRDGCVEGPLPPRADTVPGAYRPGDPADLSDSDPCPTTAAGGRPLPCMANPRWWPCCFSAFRPGCRCCWCFPRCPPG